MKKKTLRSEVDSLITERQVTKNKNAESTSRGEKVRKFGIPRPHKKVKTRYDLIKNQRNMVYDPIHNLSDNILDIDASTKGNANSRLNILHPLHSIASPQLRDSATGKLDGKVLDLLKRVGLGLVTISELELNINADMKEVILRVSGKATPKKIGGWFNFEIVRKNILAVAFTAEQAGFVDFTEKVFNTKLSLFNALEQTTVCRYVSSLTFFYSDESTIKTNIVKKYWKTDNTT